MAVSRYSIITTSPTLHNVNQNDPVMTLADSHQGNAMSIFLIEIKRARSHSSLHYSIFSIIEVNKISEIPDPIVTVSNFFPTFW